MIRKETTDWKTSTSVVYGGSLLDLPIFLRLFSGKSGLNVHVSICIKTKLFL